LTEHQKPQKQAFCGFLNVLKPPGITSAQVVGRVRRMLGGEKVGHAGTLDPEAAGVLPLMVGKAARLFDYMQDKQKSYIAEVAFGDATDTQDAQGVSTEHGGNPPNEEAIRAALLGFCGDILQTPPMYSALRRDGRRLYDLARKGETIELEPRPVTVHSLTLSRMTERDGALLAVTCSKGFYVRTLCYDLGVALGCPAHMRFLLRTQSGVFTLETAQTLENLQAVAVSGALAEAILPMELAVAHLPCLEVPLWLEKPFRNGIPLSIKALSNVDELVQGKAVRMRLAGELIAIGERQGDDIRQRTWLGE